MILWEAACGFLTVLAHTSQIHHPELPLGPPCIPESSPLEARAAPKSWPRRVDPVRICGYRGWSSLLLSVATTRSSLCGKASYFGESFTGGWYWSPLEQVGWAAVTVLGHPHSRPSFPGTGLPGAAAGGIGACDSSGASQLGLQNLIPLGRLFSLPTCGALPRAAVLRG